MFTAVRSHKLSLVSALLSTCSIASAQSLECKVAVPSDISIKDFVGRTDVDMERVLSESDVGPTESVAFLFDTLDLSQGGEAAIQFSKKTEEFGAYVNKNFKNVYLIAHTVKLGDQFTIYLNGFRSDDDDDLSSTSGSRLIIVADSLVIQSPPAGYSGLRVHSPPYQDSSGFVWGQPGSLTIVFESVEIAEAAKVPPLRELAQVLGLSEQEIASYSSTLVPEVFRAFDPANDVAKAAIGNSSMSLPEIEQTFAMAVLWERDHSPTSWLGSFFNLENGIRKETVKTASTEYINSNGMSLLRLNIPPHSLVPPALMSQWDLSRMRRIGFQIQNNLGSKDFLALQEAVQYYDDMKLHTPPPAAVPCISKTREWVDSALAQAKRPRVEKFETLTGGNRSMQAVVVHEGNTGSSMLIPNLTFSLPYQPDLSGKLGMGTVTAEGSLSLRLRVRLAADALLEASVASRVAADGRKYRGFVSDAHYALASGFLPRGVREASCDGTAENLNCSFEVIQSLDGNLFLHELVSAPGIPLTLAWRLPGGTTGTSEVMLSTARLLRPPLSIVDGTITNHGPVPVVVEYAQQSSGTFERFAAMEIAPGVSSPAPVNLGSGFTLPLGSVSVVRSAQHEQLADFDLSTYAPFVENVTIQNHIASALAGTLEVLDRVQVSVRYEWNGESPRAFEHATSLTALGTTNWQKVLQFPRIVGRKIRVTGYALYSEGSKLDIREKVSDDSLLVLSNADLVSTSPAP